MSRQHRAHAYACPPSVVAPIREVSGESDGECVCVVRSCLVRFACGPQPTNPHLDHVEVYSKSVLTHIGWRRLKPMALSSHSRAQRFSSRKTFRRRVISRRLRQKQSPRSRARKLKKLRRKDFASDEKSSTCRVGVSPSSPREKARPPCVPNLLEVINSPHIGH